MSVDGLVRGLPKRGIERVPRLLSVLSSNGQHDGGYSMTLSRTPTGTELLVAFLGCDVDQSVGVPTLAGFTWSVVANGRNASNVQNMYLAVGRPNPHYAGAYSTSFAWAAQDPANDFPNIAVMQLEVEGEWSGEAYAIGALSATASAGSVGPAAPTQTREKGGLALAGAYQDSGGAGFAGAPSSPWLSQLCSGLGGMAVYAFGAGENDHRPTPSTCTFTNASRNDNWVARMVFID